jgi:hypothetical protein
MIGMSKLQVIYGLESLFEKENPYAPVKVRKAIHSDTERNIKELESLIGILAAHRDIRQSLITRMTPDDIMEKTNSEQIAAMPSYDPCLKAKDYPFGVDYGNGSAGKIIVTSTPVEYCPTGNNGPAMMITDRFQYISDMSLVRNLLLRLTEPGEEGMNPFVKFDEYYGTGMEKEDTAKQVITSRTRIVSPDVPRYVQNTMIFSMNGHEFELGYCGLGKNGKKKEESIRIVKLHPNGNHH